VLAGTENGTGSSRDWAATETYLLRIRAIRFPNWCNEKQLV
jgi:aconitase A